MFTRAFLLMTTLLLVLNANALPKSLRQVADSGLLCTPPAGWTKTTQSGIDVYQSPLLECTDHSLYTLYAFSMFASNAALQDLAAQLHKAFFKPSASFVYQENEKRIVKGINARGNEYLYFETPAQDIITTANDHLYQYYMVYLERRNGKVAAFILTLNPYSYTIAARPLAVNGFFYECKPLARVWEQFVASVRLPGAANTLTIDKSDLVGKWASSVHTGWSGLAGNQYAVENTQLVESLTLQEDGSFVHKLATKTPATGSFQLQGNTLVLNNASGRNEKFTVGVESVFQFGHWKKTLLLTDNNNRSITLNQE